MMRLKLMREALALVDALLSILARMDLDQDDPLAYNDYHRDRVEDMIVKAQWRLERRRLSAPAWSIAESATIARGAAGGDGEE